MLLRPRVLSAGRERLRPAEMRPGRPQPEGVVVVEAAREFKVLVGVAVAPHRRGCHPRARGGRGRTRPRRPTRGSRFGGVRVAALYDVEGNLPALDAVLVEVADLRPDVVVFGGDLYCGAQPVEVIDRARAVPNARFVLGNVDRLDDVNVAYQVAQLRSDQRDFVAGFPERLVLGDVLYSHGSPRSVDEAVTMLTSDDALREMVDGIEQRVIVIGHTHTQFDRRVDGYRIVNAGSVGAAWEKTAGAYWAFVSGDDVELRRTSYDVDAAIAALRADDPNREIREAWIRGPHDPHAIAQRLEAASGR
jgi:predicted phosphodiesterase